MTRILLYITISILVFSCTSSDEEIKESTQTKIIKAEDRNDLISETDKITLEQGEELLQKMTSKQGVKTTKS